MEFISGLVSVSFRRLSVDEIIRITKLSGLSAIEWGGDIHSPAGNLEIAHATGDATRRAGLFIPEYGSYLTLGKSDAEYSRDVVRSARALGTNTVRIWAFDKNRQNTSPEEYSKVVDHARMLCDENSDFTFCLECHNRTLTENYRDAIAFIKDVDRENLGMFWQPNQFCTHEYNVEALTALLPYVRSVHVFAWEKEKKLPLEAHKSQWSDYLEILKQSKKEKVYLMLEFMYDDSPDSLQYEAKALNGWL